MSGLALVILTLLPQGGAESRPSKPPGPFVSHRFENGVTLHVRQEPDAPKQTTFSFLPLGLESDRAGEAQFAHLAEHMMIRSTDPTRLQVDGVTINGETTARVMRLESLAEPKQWRAALQRHGKWLTTRTCDEGILAREKLRIEGEERGTVPRGYNHKWAVAAWAQFMRGRRHAAVHGDVAGATADQVVAWLRGRVDLSRVHVFAIGPRAPQEQVEALAASFAELSPVREAAPADRVQPMPLGDHECTWDLRARHYLEWYELPGTELDGQMVAQAVLAACFQQRALSAIPGQVSATYARVAGRGYLLLSCNLPESVTVDSVKAAFAKACRRAQALTRIQVRGKRLSDALLTPPDFATQRRQLAGRTGAQRLQDLVEAQFAMNLGYACLRAGVEPARLAAAYGSLAGDVLARALATSVDPKRRTSATITSKTRQP